MNKVMGIRLSFLVASACILGCSTQVLAQSSVNLGTVSKTNTQSEGQTLVQKLTTATFQAPTKSSVKVTQPTSVLNSHYIENNAAPTSNFTDIANIAPSVSSVNPNGAGGMESQGLQMRGFQDGEFNVLFDGISFGDSNDFTHHSTGYFTTADTGKISVDRGPGTATTIGDATFGGTISIYSVNPSNEASITPYATYGSFNTKLVGLKADTGYLKALGMDDTKAYINYSHSSTDGAIQYAHQRRDNFMAKTQTAIGGNTVLTLFALYNKIHQNVPVGASAQQLAAHGNNYGGLNNDPTSQAYQGYNYDRIQTDMEYIGLKSEVGKWKVDNKLYTYAYIHSGYNGEDPSLMSSTKVYTPDHSTLLSATGNSANGVAGQTMTMNYRSIGDVLRTSRPVPMGTLKLGVWADFQTNTRSQYEINWITKAPNPIAGAGDNNATDREMTDTLTSVQPYIEYDIKPIKSLTLKPGVRYVSFSRSISATVNQGTGKQLTYAQTWTKLLPSLSANYKIQNNWSVYAQWAQGFLAPNLNTFYVTNPAKNSVDPESTTNYQVGTVFNNHRLSLAADGYYINFNNLAGKRTVSGQTQYYNNGGVIYKGLEASGTVYIGEGFSLYANGSLNSAKTKSSHQWIANAPDDTYAGGLIFNKYNIYASLLAKHIGSMYGDSGETQKMNGYTIANLNLNYKLKNLADRLGNAKISFQIRNLFDKKGAIAFAGYGGDGTTPLYWTAPGTAYYVSLSLKFK